MSIPPFSVIIPAAGSGLRFGSAIPKQYLPLNGVQVLAHAIRAFSAFPECCRIIVVIDEQYRSEAEHCADGIRSVRFVPGGTERQHSIANALSEISEDSELVLVHDAARPNISRHLIERVIAAAVEHGAAIPTLPIAETVKRVDEHGRILETIPRQNLRTAQTPQAFRKQLLMDAYAYASTHALITTDDASVVEAFGVEVFTVPGEAGNIKITIEEDLQRLANIGETGKAQR